jgi:hypothetical protein
LFILINLHIRGEYSNYDSPQRAKIAKYACEHGNASAVRHFSIILGKPISESTVRSMIKQYLRERDHSPHTILTELLKVRFYQPLFKRHFEHWTPVLFILINLHIGTNKKCSRNQWGMSIEWSIIYHERQLLLYKNNRCRPKSYREIFVSRLLCFAFFCFKTVSRRINFAITKMLKVQIFRGMTLVFHAHMRISQS